jgi:hypothetical protein
VLCILLFEKKEREREKKGEMARGLFSQVRHALLTVLFWDIPCC